MRNGKIVLNVFGYALGLLAVMSGAKAESPLTTCPLASAVEAARAFEGVIGNDARRVSSEAMTICVFKGDKGGAVTVLVRHNLSKHWLADQQNRMRHSTNSRGMEGVGDAAFVLDRHQEGAVLCVFRGEDYVQVSAFGLGAADAVSPAAKQLAQTLVSRLTTGRCWKRIG